MRIPVFCFLKERDRYGYRQGAGCKRACSGCNQDVGVLFIDEVPPDYVRGHDKAHKSKKYPKIAEEVKSWETQ